MVVRENGLLLNGVLYAVLGLVRGLLRLEVYKTAGVLPVFQQVNNRVCRPFTLIAGVLATEGGELLRQFFRGIRRRKKLAKQAAKQNN